VIAPSTLRGTRGTRRPVRRRRKRRSALSRARTSARSALDGVIERVLARKSALGADEMATITTTVAPRAGLVKLDTGDRRPGRGAVERHVGHARRGAPDAATVDRADLDLTVRELVAARAALLEAHAMPDVTPEERREKREARAAAMAKLGLASRMLDDVVLRRRGTLG
jgi:hypothetical protein